MTDATAPASAPQPPALAYEVAGRSVVGKVRQRNEDAFGRRRLDGDSLVLLVADGMGRYGGGDLASKAVVASIRGSLPRHVALRRPPIPDGVAVPDAAPGDVIGDALVAAFLTAQEALCEMAQADPGLGKMGTTIVAAVLTPSGVGWSNAGDSRLLWLTGDGVLRRVSRDHSVAQVLVDLGQLDEEQAATHPMAANLTSFLGPDLAWEKVRVSPAPGEASWFVPQPGDVLALCTDGVTGALSTAVLTDLLARPGKAKSRAQRVIDAVMKTEARDNATIYVAVVGRADLGAEVGARA